MPKRSLDDLLAEVPEWVPSDDEEELSDEEVARAAAYEEFDALQAAIGEKERELEELREAACRVLAKLDAMPGARYVPTETEECPLPA